MDLCGWAPGPGTLPGLDLLSTRPEYIPDTAAGMVIEYMVQGLHPLSEVLNSDNLKSPQNEFVTYPS